MSGAARGTRKPCPEWYYLDLSGKEFGPFSGRTMRQWYEDGCFDKVGKRLLVRLPEWKTHGRLSQLFDGDVDSYFLAFPVSAPPGEIHDEDEEEPLSDWEHRKVRVPPDARSSRSRSRRGRQRASPNSQQDYSWRYESEASGAYLPDRQPTSRDEFHAPRDSPFEERVPAQPPRPEPRGLHEEANKQEPHSDAGPHPSHRSPHPDYGHPPPDSAPPPGAEDRHSYRPPGYSHHPADYGPPPGAYGYGAPPGRHWPPPGEPPPGAHWPPPGEPPPSGHWPPSGEPPQGKGGHWPPPPEPPPGQHWPPPPGEPPPSGHWPPSGEPPHGQGGHWPPPPEPPPGQHLPPPGEPQRQLPPAPHTYGKGAPPGYPAAGHDGYGPPARYGPPPHGYGPPPPNGSYGPPPAPNSRYGPPPAPGGYDYWRYGGPPPPHGHSFGPSPHEYGPPPPHHRGPYDDGWSDRGASDDGQRKRGWGKQRSNAKRENLELNSKIIKFSESVAKGEKSLNDLLAEIEYNINRMNEVNLSTAFHRIAKISKANNQERMLRDSRFRDLQERVRRALWHSLDLLGSSEGKQVPMSAACVCWSHATLRIPDSPLFAEVARRCSPYMRDFKSLEVANILWAFAKLGENEKICLDVFHAAASEVMARPEVFTVVNMSTLAWAFATARVRQREFFKFIAHRIGNSVSQAESQEIANTLWAFATAGCYEKKLFTYLGDQAAQKLRSFKAQEAANSAWAFGRASVAHLTFFSSLEDRLRAWEVSAHGLTEFEPQHMAMIVGAASTLYPVEDATDPDSEGDDEDGGEDRDAEEPGETSGAANSDASVAGRGQPVAWGLVSLLLPECMRKLRQFKLEETARVLLACSRLGLRRSGAAPPVGAEQAALVATRFVEMVSVEQPGAMEVKLRR